MLQIDTHEIDINRTHVFIVYIAHSSLFDQMNYTSRFEFVCACVHVCVWELS